METSSAWLNPVFLLAAGVQLVLVIFFIAKLWLRANAAHERLDDIEEHFEDEIKELKTELKEAKGDFYKHIADMRLHHNEQAVLEFRNGLERRLGGMESSLSDINRKLNHLGNRE